jgi:hypothetical protein
MANTKISALTSSTTPLAGTEVLPIVQSSATVKVSVSNLTAGRSVSATSFVPSGSTIPANGLYLPAANAVGIATNSTNAIYIDSSQNLAVNTTSAIGKITLAIGNGGNALSTQNVSGTANYNAALFYNNGTTSLCGYINVTGSITNYVSISDYRLKENIIPMTGALAKVSALKPVTYKWKSDGSDGQGFIAHELQAFVPDCVIGKKDEFDDKGNPKYQGIDTSFLVATLTAAIQEQQTLIVQLQADVAELKKR